MNTFLNSIENLPRIANILFAIIPPLYIIHFIYSIIYDISINNVIGLIIDILLFALTTFPYYILNLIFVIIYNKPFSISYFLK